MLQPIRGHYGEYRFFKANRDIRQSSLNAISDDVEETYLLDLYPIVTDMERVILDGQHRLSVAKEMQLPFYAIHTNDITIEDIASANSNTLAYTVSDASSVYEKMGLEAYAYVNDFVRKHAGLTSIGYAARLLDRQFNKMRFLDGLFCASRFEYAGEVMHYVKDYSDVQKFAKSAPYRRALENLALNPLYDHDKRMVRRLKNAPLKLMKCNTIDEAFLIITELYNYHAMPASRQELKFLIPGERVDRFDKKNHELNDHYERARRGMACRPVVINSTSDYARFSLHPSRRPLDPKRQEKLVEAMRKKDLLSCYPLICDPLGVILDGQRRFLAAVELGLPIHYIESSSASLPMLLRASTRSKAWVFNDYLKHFCVLGLKDYLTLSDLAKQASVKQDSIFRMLGEYTGDLSRGYLGFRAGQFKIVNLEDTKRTIDCVNRLSQKSLKNNQTFTLCLFDFIRKDPTFDIDRFVRKANTFPRVMMGFVNKETCVERILKTYNYHQPPVAPQPVLVDSGIHISPLT
ncbi:MAG: hypothetical protein ABI557_09005 [Aureliella sp.]